MGDAYHRTVHDCDWSLCRYLFGRVREKNRLTRLIELNILNLASMPSILYGLLALGLFVHQMKLGSSLLTVGMTLSLLVLPVVIVASREALRSLPFTLKEASYALGATQFQTLIYHQVPAALSGIMTGVILCLI